VVRTLSGVLGEVGREEVELLRAATARSLMWCAARGSKLAEQVLYDAVSVNDIAMSLAGSVVADSLLCAVGAEAAFRELRKAVLGDASSKVALRGYGRACTASTCLFSSLQPYHLGLGRSVTGFRSVEAGRLAQGLRRISQRRFEELLESEVRVYAVLDYIWIPACTTEGGRELAYVLLSRIADSKRYRSTVADVLSNNRGGIWWALDTRSLRALHDYLPSIPDKKTRDGLMVVVDRVCFGQGHEVLSGKATLEEILRGKMEVLATESAWKEEKARWAMKGTVSPDGGVAVTYKSRLDVLDGTFFQTLRQRSMLGTQQLPPEIACMRRGMTRTDMDWSLRAEEARKAAAAVVAGDLDPRLLQETVGRVIQEANRDGVKLEEQELYGLAVLLGRAAEEESLVEVVLEAVEQLGGMPLARGAIADAVGGSVWMDIRLPVPMAEALIDRKIFCLQHGIETMEDVDGLDLKTGPQLPEAFKHITPEVPPGFESDFVLDVRMNMENPPPPPKPDPAAWRAWLERFRELPVFRGKGARRAE
jgi:hypothetical protein